MTALGQWFKSKSFQALALGIGSSLLVLGASRLGIFSTLENRSLDWRFRTFIEPARSRDGIVIIALDDTSFDSKGFQDNFGRWPPRRQLYAGLVHYLHEWGAKAIAMDLLFQGPDPHAGDDALLSQALAERRDVVLAFALNQGKFRETDPEAPARLREKLARFAVRVRLEGTPTFRSYSGIDLAQDEFLKSVPSIGCITVQSDGDGPVRRVTPLFRFEKQYYPSLPLAVAALVAGEKRDFALSPGPALVFKGRAAPLDDQGQMFIRWYGPEHTFKHYSVWKVFNSAFAYEKGEKPELPVETFKDKIVFIGATATGAADVRPTAFSETYPAVELQATVTANLLNGDFLRFPRRGTGAVAIVLMAFLLAGIVFLFNSASLYSFLAVLVGAAYFAVACAEFGQHQLWIPMVAPLASGAVAFTSSTLLRYATEGREKRRYRQTLVKYVSPQLVETIMSDFDWAGLRADKKTLTVLFSDVRGFTTFSEKYPPETVVATLNEHLNMMVSVIFKYGGTLDKFVGDCVMAFWGAPLAQRNHAELAARAALEMIAGLEKLNQKWQSEGRPTLQVGVGINTGDMLFGNIGSEQRMDFTVIGDSVNLGSRLESATKELHASIVISEATYHEIRQVARVRPLGEISVKGKEQKVVVYELLGMTETLSAKGAA